MLDASAVIALLLDEPTAAHVASLLEITQPRMSTVNAAEAIDVLVRRHGGSIDEVTAVFDELAGSIEPVAPSLELASRAGELRARHFRRDRRLSLADCFAVATAEGGDSLATADGTLAAVARDEGIEVIVLEA